MQKFSLSSLSFFLLPLFLSLGISLQAIGFYLFALLIPAFFLPFSLESQNKLKLLRLFGVSLVLIYLIPVFSNMIYFKSFSLSYFKSSWSSSFLVTGIFFLLFPRIFSYHSPLSSLAIKHHRYFMLGLMFSLVLLTLFCIIQSIFGFDLRNRNSLTSHLTSDQLMGMFYRAVGFYGHPLSLAAVGLHLSFFSYYLMQQGIPYSQGYKVCFACSSVLVFLTGGRWAQAVYLGLIIFDFIRKKSLRILNSKSLVLMEASSFLFLFQRFSDLKKDPFDRLKFWITHLHIFGDYPLWGVGPYALKTGLRSLYYQTLGYENLRDKFEAHNFYIELLSETGIVGAFLTGAIIYICLNKIYLYTTRDSQSFLKNLMPSYGQSLSYHYFKAFLWGLGANCLNSLTQNVFFDSNVTYPILGTAIITLWLILIETPPSSHSTLPTV